jgi:hypothetical protein
VTQPSTEGSIYGRLLQGAYKQARFRIAQPHVVLFLQHRFCSTGQLGHDDETHVQVPLWQLRLFPHTCPHEPQLLLSVCSATHTPLQLV